jgi:pyrophosphatase PpaX
VVNTIPLIIASYEHAMWSVLGVKPSPEEARGWIGQTLYDTFSQRNPDRAAELVDSYVAWNADHLQEFLQDYPGVDDLLGDLTGAGATIAVVTSKRQVSADNTLRSAGLAERLPVLVAMEDTDVHKPNPEPLLLALARLGAGATECVYIGDAVVDVQAARAAGMAAIAVTWGAGERADLVAAGPLAVVDTMEELRAQLLD